MYVKMAFAALVYKPDFGSYKSAVRRTTGAFSPPAFNLIYQTFLEASVLSEPGDTG